MTETREEMARRLLQFHEPVHRNFGDDITAFHEWNVEFATTKFKAKVSNDKPVTFFTFHRNDAISVLETPYGPGHEKRAVFEVIRKACDMDRGMNMMSAISEIWIKSFTNVDPGNPRKGQLDEEGRPYKEMRRQYKEIRHMPGREDGLMVATYHRDGRVKMTRWVVKLKHNPANNRMLERDDVPDADTSNMYGQAFGFMQPEKPMSVIEGEEE